MAHINVFYESKVHVLQEIEYNEQMFWVFTVLEKIELDYHKGVCNITGDGPV